MFEALTHETLTQILEVLRVSGRETLRTKEDMCRVLVRFPKETIEQAVALLDGSIT